MNTFLKVIENTTWYRQFVYGTILAAFFGLVTFFAGFNPFWVVVQVAIIAGVREHYLHDLLGTFNWRNFFFLLIPVALFYMIWTSL